MSNFICYKCYEDIRYKDLLTKNEEYKCKLCKKNIFFTTKYIINNFIKKKILKDYNNNRDCALKECCMGIESFEKTSVLICSKCIFEYKNLNNNNYSVVKPDKMCLLCNYSCCSSYNFHINCFEKFICTNCDSFK